MTPGLDAPPTGRLRPLPRPVAPVGNELRSSFVRRVALANRLNAEEFRAYVAADDRKRAAIPLDRLAILSGQPEPRLRRALDDSSDPADPDGMVRAACTLCMAARNIAIPVTVRLAATAVVCPRHQRWLGAGHCNGQPPLHRHPEILAANRSHRALVRRLGPTRTRYALSDAEIVCQDWQRHNRHQTQCQELLRRFHPHQTCIPAGAPTIEAARYPQVVALAQILWSPTLRELPFTPATVSRFVEAVRRTVAPTFTWTTTSHYGRCDPLFELFLTEQRCRRAGESTRSPVFATPQRPFESWPDASLSSPSPSPSAA